MFKIYINKNINFKNLMYKKTYQKNFIFKFKKSNFKTSIIK